MVHRDPLRIGLPVHPGPHFLVAECNLLDAQLERTMGVVCRTVFVDIGQEIRHSEIAVPPERN